MSAGRERTTSMTSLAETQRRAGQNVPLSRSQAGMHWTREDHHQTKRWLGADGPGSPILISHPQMERERLCVYFRAGLPPSEPRRIGEPDRESERKAVERVRRRWSEEDDGMLWSPRSGGRKAEAVRGRLHQRKARPKVEPSDDVMIVPLGSSDKLWFKSRIRQSIQQTSFDNDPFL